MKENEKQSMLAQAREKGLTPSDWELLLNHFAGGKEMLTVKSTYGSKEVLTFDDYLTAASDKTMMNMTLEGMTNRDEAIRLLREVL